MEPLVPSVLDEIPPTLAPLPIVQTPEQVTAPHQPMRIEPMPGGGLSPDDLQRSAEYNAIRVPAQQSSTMGEVWESTWGKAKLETPTGVGRPLADAYMNLRNAVARQIGSDEIYDYAQSVGLGNEWKNASGFEGRARVLESLIATFPAEQQKQFEELRDIRRIAIKTAARTEKIQAEIYANSVGMSAAAVAFAATVAAQSTDFPTILANVWTAPVGGPFKGPLVQVFARQTGAAALSQALVEPYVQEQRARLELESGLGHAAWNVAGAAAGGFIITAGVRGAGGLWAGLRKLHPGLPEPRAAPEVYGPPERQGPPEPYGPRDPRRPQPGETYGPPEPYGPRRPPPGPAPSPGPQAAGPAMRTVVDIDGQRTVVESTARAPAPPAAAEAPAAPPAAVAPEPVRPPVEPPAAPQPAIEAPAMPAGDMAALVRVMETDALVQSQAIQATPAGITTHINRVDDAASSLERGVAQPPDNPADVRPIAPDPTPAEAPRFTKRQLREIGDKWKLLKRPADHEGFGTAEQTELRRQYRRELEELGVADAKSINELNRILRGEPQQRGVVKGPRARDPEQWSAIEYLASKGGLRNDGDNKAIGQKLVPGFGNMLRNQGLTDDKAAELLAGIGYISRDEFANNPRIVKEIYEAWVRHGQNLYLPNAKARTVAIDPLAEAHYFERELLDRLSAEGHELDEVPERILAAVRRRVAEGEENWAIAYERALMEDAAPTVRLDDDAAETPGPGRDDLAVREDAGAAPGARGEAAAVDRGPDFDPGRTGPGGEIGETARPVRDLAGAIDTGAGPQTALVGGRQPVLTGDLALPPTPGVTKNAVATLPTQITAPVDPLDLAMAGQLTAQRARTIADELAATHRKIENEIFGSAELADQWRRLIRQKNSAWDNARDAEATVLQAQINKLETDANLTRAQEDYLDGHWPENTDPDAWKDLARNLNDIELGRADALEVVAGEMRYLPRQLDWERMTSAERQAVLSILSALNAENAAGRDVAAFLDAAARARIARYGGGPDAEEVTNAQLDELRAILAGGIQRGPRTEPVTAAAATEATEAGEQVLLPGVKPVTTRERLEVEGARPMEGGAAPPPAGGLFDETARGQLDLSDFAGDKASAQDALRVLEEAGGDMTITVHDAQGNARDVSAIAELQATRKDSIAADELLDCAGGAEEEIPF